MYYALVFLFKCTMIMCNDIPKYMMGVGDAAVYPQQA
jgi:hypothetical protein